MFSYYINVHMYIIIRFGMLKLRLFRVENNRRQSYELSTYGVCGATKIRERPKTGQSVT